jgi:asparagine synthase (glutamine-hydrolysing)
MTMANSLEGRSPFLDYELVEWVARLPDSMKLRGSTHKYLLKKTFAPLLPPDILRRAKQGFGIPVGKWFRGQLRGMARDLLLSERFLKRELFRRDALERIFNEHDSGRADHGKRIWCLIMLELWWRRYLNE